MLRYFLWTWALDLGMFFIFVYTSRRSYDFFDPHPALFYFIISVTVHYPQAFTSCYVKVTGRL
ncbi:uncharacterized protein BKA55DRAFT_550538 [Fusarium redolens]|uniref:Uncharacterized protein n=1 Tax=Fusarium redolens TaxID=48865 RepID=A0A9P9KWX6_FUSRE|nr:uncharacterized protein BKA55DRAFT_550538 [Fusarium redolens]KAH7270074.1 hypothetical protein BKA55DRAFT_550538 [Fusarium redolens]